MMDIDSKNGRECFQCPRRRDIDDTPGGCESVDEIRGLSGTIFGKEGFFYLIENVCIFTHCAAAIGGGFDYNTSDGTDCGTIIIEGGVLNLIGGYECPGIGSGAYASCDGITIKGGIIKNSKGGQNAAGIGAGYSGNCGDILISGGRIGGEIDNSYYNGAQGNMNGAGIGCGAAGTCGNITIGPDITFLVAKKGENAQKHIGLVDGGSCGTVTVAPELVDSGESGLVRTIQPATP